MPGLTTAAAVTILAVLADGPLGAVVVSGVGVALVWRVRRGKTVFGRGMPGDAPASTSHVARRAGASTVAKAPAVVCCVLAAAAADYVWIHQALGDYTWIRQTLDDAPPTATAFVSYAIVPAGVIGLVFGRGTMSRFRWAALYLALMALLAFTSGFVWMIQCDDCIR
jgi:hypothetical protein